MTYAATPVTNSLRANRAMPDVFGRLTVPFLPSTTSNAPWKASRPPRLITKLGTPT